MTPATTNVQVLQAKLSLAGRAIQFLSTLALAMVGWFLIQLWDRMSAFEAQMHEHAVSTEHRLTALEQIQPRMER